MFLSRSTGPPTAEQMWFVEGLFRKYRALMYKYARGRDRDQHEADDIVSEALKRLFRNADTLMALAEYQQSDYIVTTIRSVVGDHYRRRKTQERFHAQLGEEDIIDPGLEEDFIERESRDTQIRHLYETLDELQETDRLLLTGKYMSGLSDEALARQLGVKASSIRMKLTRARKRARRILEGKEAESDGKNIG